MNATLAALAEPNRLRIVEYLREGPRSVNEIVGKLQLPQPLVSKHLRVLKTAGLVEVHPDAQRRLYRLQAVRFKELDRWLGTFRRLWEDRLDTLEDYLKEANRIQTRTSN